MKQTSSEPEAQLIWKQTVFTVPELIAANGSNTQALGFVTNFQ